MGRTRSGALLTCLSVLTLMCFMTSGSWLGGSSVLLRSVKIGSSLHVLGWTSNVTPVTSLPSLAASTRPCRSIYLLGPLPFDINPGLIEPTTVSPCVTDALVSPPPWLERDADGALSSSPNSRCSVGCSLRPLVLSLEMHALKGFVQTKYQRRRAWKN